jgi:Flp pilus assembly pilin Flp
MMHSQNLRALVRDDVATGLGRDEGQTLAEYAMILALIALVVVLVVAFLGTTISSLFTQIASGI